MCSLLLNSLAVPCGLVTNFCEQDLPHYCGLNNSACICCLHNFYPHLFYYGTAHFSAHHTANSSAGAPLPDLIMSHDPSAQVNSPSGGSSSVLASVPQFGETSNPTASGSQPKPQTTPTKFPRFLCTTSWSHHQHRAIRLRKRSAGKTRLARDPCVPSDGVRHILEIRHRFPDSATSPTRRQEFTLSWEGGVNYEYNCTHCSGTYTFTSAEMRFEDDDWSRVGRKLRRIADEFELGVCKKRHSVSLVPSFDVSCVQNFVTHCFFFSFIGVWALRVYCRLK